MRPVIAVLGVAALLCFTPLAFNDDRSGIDDNRYNIDWGSHGIPHIQSATDGGVLEGQGYAMALCQAPHMFMLYAKAMGTSAQYFGNGNAGLSDSFAQSDYKATLWSIPETALGIVSNMDLETTDLLHNFCKGINEAKHVWLNSPQLPAPYRLLMEEMEVAPVHVVAASIRNAIIPILWHTIDAVAEGKATKEDLFPTDSSNAWALIDRQGVSWLMADPHINFGFEDETRIVFSCALDGDKLHTRGVNYLALPFQGMGVKVGREPGHQSLSWTYTAAAPDMGDVYVLEWDVARDHYIMEDGPRDFMVKPYCIKFATGPTLRGEHRYTIHGPVIKEDDAAGQVYAGRGVWQIWPQCLRMIEQWHRMCTAENFDALIAAMDNMAFPGGNVMIASSSSRKAEKICYMLYYPTPVRDDSVDWTVPVDGSRHAHLWTQVHPRHWLPTVQGDQSDLLINCNCSIDITWPGFKRENPRYPRYLIYDWGIYTFRQERAMEVLRKPVFQGIGGGEEPYLDFMYGAVMDKSHGFARHLVPYITAAYQQWGDLVEDRNEYLGRAVPMLKAWSRNRAAAVNSSEMYLFNIWVKMFKAKYHYSEFFDFPSQYPSRFDRTQGTRALEVLIEAYDHFLKQLPAKGQTWGKNHQVSRDSRSGTLSWGVSGDWCCLRSAHGPETGFDYGTQVSKGQICPMIIKMTDPPQIWFSKAVDNCTWTMATWIFDERCPCTRDWAAEKFIPFPGD